MSSVSQILRQTRESKGITLEEVAQRTYIKLPYLNALEDGDVEKLPAPVYIHGYIRQYAKLLGLNGSELVLQYQQDASRPAASKLVLTPANRVNAALAELNQPSEEFKPRTAVERAAVPALERVAPAMDLCEPADNLPTAFAEPVREQLVPISETSLREPAHVEASPPSAHELLVAKQQAHQILSSAQREAQEMRIAAERYADQVLAQLENEINRSLQTVRNGRAFLQSRRRKLQEG